MSSIVFRHFCQIGLPLILLSTSPVHAETLTQAWEVALAGNHSLKAAQEIVAAAEE